MTLPTSWISVKHHLEALKGEQKTITYEQFQEICRLHHVPDPSHRPLCRYLHDTVNLLHFANYQQLESLVILDPTWATDLIYKILDPKLRRQKGVFDRDYVTQILHDRTPEEQKTFLELLLRFELCFEHPTQKDHFVAAQLLPDTPPDAFEWIWESPNYCRLIYHYPQFFPKSVMMRFLAQFGSRAKKSIFWKGAVLLDQGENRFFVEARPNKNEIRVAVKGAFNHPFLAEIHQAFQEISRPFKVTETVTCCCEECLQGSSPFLFSRDKLLQHRKLGDLPPVCYQSRILMTSSKLLEGTLTRRELEQHLPQT